jgi:hypothetical protein
MGESEIVELSKRIVENSHAIPNEIDARLLASARSKIERDLNEPERHSLRRAFREMTQATAREARAHSSDLQIFRHDPEEKLRRRLLVRFVN